MITAAGLSAGKGQGIPWILFDPVGEDFEEVHIQRFAVEVEVGLQRVVEDLREKHLSGLKIVQDLPEGQVQAIVEATIEELAEPMGLPSFYAVEFFTPDLAGYHLHSNDLEDETTDEPETT